MKGQTFDKVSFALRFKAAHVVVAGNDPMLERLREWGEALVDR